MRFERLLRGPSFAPCRRFQGVSLLLCDGAREGLRFFRVFVGFADQRHRLVLQRGHGAVGLVVVVVDEDGAVVDDGEADKLGLVRLRREHGLFFLSVGKVLSALAAAAA